MPSHPLPSSHTLTMQLKEKRKQAKKEGRDTIEEDDPVKVCVSEVGEEGGETREGRGRGIVCRSPPESILS